MNSVSLPKRPEGLLGDLAPEDMNDACCWACAGGGDVVCCDGCRAVYHLACIGLDNLPEDDWYCPLCHCKECGQVCKCHSAPAFIYTTFIPTQPKALLPRQHCQQWLPTGPGYLCPQQMRQWLQPEQHQSVAHAGNAGAGGISDDMVNQQEQQPRPKRQKAGELQNLAHICIGPTSPAGGSSTASCTNCCCCQRSCHIKCLPAELHSCSSASLLSPAKPAKVSSKGDRRSSNKQHQRHLQQPLEPYFCSLGCQQISEHLVRRCAQGVMQVDALADGTPICWQLIQPAAVATALQPSLAATATSPAAEFSAGQKSAAAAAAAEAVPSVGLLGTAMAVHYSKVQADVLAQVIRDSLQLLSEAAGPAWEVRTYQDTIPWLLAGLRQHTPGGLLDLSHFHLAVLWVGCTLCSAAVMRLHGAAVLEVTFAATQPQLQHKQLGRLLMAHIERFALETCKVKQAWMPALGGVVKPCVGVSVLPTWAKAAGTREQLQLAACSCAELLGINTVAAAAKTAATAAAAVAAVGSDSSVVSASEQLADAAIKPQKRKKHQNGQRRSSAGTPNQVGAVTNAEQQQRQQPQPKDLNACWALQLKYGPAPTVQDWLQLPQYRLLRYSYVPFVTKRLSPETLVPLPHCRKRMHDSVVNQAGPKRAIKGGGSGHAAPAAPTGATGVMLPAPQSCLPPQQQYMPQQSLPTWQQQGLQHQQEQQQEVWQAHHCGKGE